jgi:hypothetical protein
MSCMWKSCRTKCDPRRHFLLKLIYTNVPPLSWMAFGANARQQVKWKWVLCSYCPSVVSRVSLTCILSPEALHWWGSNQKTWVSWEHASVQPRSHILGGEMISLANTYTGVNNPSFQVQLSNRESTAPFVNGRSLSCWIWTKCVLRLRSSICSEAQIAMY